MSSLRNAISRRAHKERAQPTNTLILHPWLLSLVWLLDREEARELQSQASESRVTLPSGDIPDLIKKTAASYRELEARKSRVNQLEKLYMEMSLNKELQGQKRKLREDELVCPTSKPVYKWRSERKRSELKYKVNPVDWSSPTSSIMSTATLAPTSPANLLEPGYLSLACLGPDDRFPLSQTSGKGGWLYGGV
ncbi:hypothetical protein GOBAR_AA31099 [Gossypium barbadense]|uniref:Uncharacterized protein n=1 Tax=Gossypium barbadense TaxID=3634 RepID=A0A2P5WER2_GOSBA|nr:hypothetical protein GOBAR_AA31099 [Gossypium barbadense]